jgi:hypothetical protein
LGRAVLNDQLTDRQSEQSSTLMSVSVSTRIIIILKIIISRHSKHTTQLSLSQQTINHMKSTCAPLKYYFR